MPRFPATASTIAPALAVLAAMILAPPIAAADAADDAIITPPPDWRQARVQSREHASHFAALRAGTGLDAQQQRAAEKAAIRRAAPAQPHYATTHPWVQRPVAHAGAYVRPPFPDVHPPRLPVPRLPPPVLHPPGVITPPPILIPHRRR